jgi:hypothetical protein
MTALPKDPVPPVISKVLSANTGLMVSEEIEPYFCWRTLVTVAMCSLRAGRLATL